MKTDSDSDSLRAIRVLIATFAERCERDGTDIGDAWEIFRLVYREAGGDSGAHGGRCPLCGMRPPLRYASSVDNALT